ncbi:glyoxalase, partial [Pseudomonas syringae]|nr:glyoxalase [Pseudomonas syringae]
MQTLQTSTPARLCYLHLASKEPQQQVDFYRRMLDMEGLAQADGSWQLKG